jgi:hypothetical protein
VDRIRLIELIEGQAARLSAEGRDLWVELGFLRESIPDPEEPSRMAREHDIMERIFELPLCPNSPSPAGWRSLWPPFAGQRRLSAAGNLGTAIGLDSHRARGVINAAMLKDREEGRPIDARMTLSRAVARLEEHE